MSGDIGLGARRARRQRMPASAAELSIPRWAWWPLVLGNCVLAGAATYFGVGVLASGAPRPAIWTIVLLGVAAWFWALSLVVSVLVLYRPRRSIDSAVVAPSLVQLAGSRRLLIGQLVWLAVTAVLLVSILLGAQGGWILVCAVLLAAVAAAAVSVGLALPHASSLQLTPTGVRASWVRGDAAIDWADVAGIVFVHGAGGLMVARIQAGPDSPSFTRYWRLPLSGSARVVDIEPLTLDLDPLLLLMALQSYRLSSSARNELRDGHAPDRLFSVTAATASTPPEIQDIYLSRFRPREA